MPNSPTIVSAALSDKELQDSINKMVANFDKGLQTMLEHSNEYVGKIQASLQKIGDTNFGAKGSNDGGVAKQTKAQNEFTDAVKKSTNEIKRQGKEAATSYDQMAAAIQKASRMPSEMRPEKPETRARDSYYAFVAGLKEQRDSLAKVINDFERGLNNAISKRTNEINNQITASKNKIQELNQELNRANATRNAVRASQVQGQLDKELRHYKDLELQLKNVNNEFGTSKISLAAMNAEHHRLANLMREEAQVQQQQAQATQQQITEEQRRTEEIRKQAQAIRESQQWKENKTYQWTDNGVTYRVTESKKLGTLEEQLLQIHRQQTAELNRQISEEQGKEQAARRYAATLKEQVALARQFFTETGKDKMFLGNFYGSDITRNPVAQYIYQENDARAQGLSIEQQIEQILRQHEETVGRIIQQRQSANKKNEKGIADNTFKKSLASTLGISTDDVNSTGTSIKSITNYANQLKQAWDRLSSSGRNSPFGKELKEEMLMTERQLKRLRAEATRPISLNFIKGQSEKTIDDITYKIQQLQSYKRGLNLTDPKQVAELRQVDSEINRLQKDLNKYMGTTKQATELNHALSRSWNYMKNRLAFYFTVGASTQFIKNLIDIRSQYELNERALGILIGSAERGTQIFNELSQMALVSPYTLIELSSAAKQLTAYDVAARDVVDTTRRLADMASAVGVPMERLTYALGQIKAYGYLNSRDNRMFANAGIPLVKQLADYYTELEGRMVSTADVYDRIKKKAVDYNTVMQVIYRMTDEGGKFFDFQAKMADTLKVRLANLTLAWNNMLNDIGKETQGFLSFGIGALRTLFLHWKTLDKLIKNIAWVVGLRTAFMLLSYAALKFGGALGVTTKQMALSTVFGNRLAGVLRTVGMAMKALVTSPLTWWSLLAIAAVEAATQIFSANEATVSLNKSLREGAETNFKDISDYLAQYQKVADSLYGGKSSNAYELQSGQYKTGEISTPTDINVDEANKAWEAMRERIELSTAASEEFVGRLLTIENVSERLRQGFILLNDIQRVNSAMKDLGDTAIVITQDWSKWWNLWIGTDGLIENLGDVKDELDDVVKKFGSLAEARKQATGTNEAWEDVSDYDNAMKTLKGDIDETTESLNNFIRNMGFASNPDQVAEVYAQALQKISAESNLDPQRAYMLQQGFENARGEAMKEALEARIADEEAALKLARENETRESLKASIERNEAQLELFTKYTNDQRTEWERFTKYMKENHISEMQAMFGQMDEEQIRSINWQEGKYLDFVKRTAAAYAKRHNMAYEDVFNRLWGLIHKTNLMQIFLKLTISTEEHKSFSAQLKEYDQMANDAYTNLKRIQERISQLAAAGAESVLSKYHKEYLALKKEESDLLSSYQDYTSIEKGGKSSKEEKENAKAAKAASAARKKEAAAARKAQREAESELQKAFKDELQIIDKLRSQYKKLTDNAVGSKEAIRMVTSQFGNSIKHFNDVFEKNGIPKFNVRAFLGTENPREILKQLNAQREAAKTAKNVKPVEIKDLELKIGDIEVEAKAYDTKKVLDGLKSSFDNLEKEYELSLELDANPELGDMFTGIFNIPTDDLPKTFKEFYERANAEAEKALKGIGVDTDYNIFDILGTRITGKGGYAEQIGRSEESLKSLIDIQEKVQKRFKDIVIATEKDLDDYIKKYGDYSDKIAEIEAGRLEKLKRLNDHYALANRNTPEYRAQLAAIEQGAAREAATAEFEAFKNSRFYEEMFENIEYASTASLKAIVGRLNELKGSLKDLSPEQMKYIVQQTEKINTELLKRNPFKGLANNVRGYIEALKKGGTAQKEFLAAQKNYNEQEKIVTALKAIRKLKLDGQKLDEANIKHVAKISGIEENSLSTAIREEGIEEASAKELDSKVEAAQALLDVLKEILDATDKENQRFNLAKKLLKEQAAQIVNVVGSNLQSLGELKSFLTEDLGVDIGAEMEGMFDGLQKTGQGMQSIVSSLTSGNVVGALVGVGQTFYGIYDSIASIFGGGSAKNKRIDRQIKDSEMQVKRLENAYKNLEFTVEQAYGTMAVGARQAAIANKELQLAELKRQLALEKSRDSKHRDEQRILDLRGQIIDLKNEIIKSYQEIATDLLGISSVADAAESMMDAYIAALRSGEDAMESFEGSVKDMVANIIKKLFVTKVIAPELERLVDDMNERITNRSSKEAKAYEEAVRKQSEFEEQYDDESLDFMYRWGKRFGQFQEYATVDDFIKAMRAPYGDAVKQAKKELDKVTTPTLEDIDLVAQEAYAMIPALENMNDDIVAMLQRYDLIESDLDKTGNLSALQQGLQSMSEDTANALEALMNGFSQQSYLQSDLLTQIRDAVVAMDYDVQLGVFSQMLLQLQNNYIVMQSMQSMMQNWTIPSGSGIRVELVG